MSASEKLKALEGPLTSITRIEVEGPIAGAVFRLGAALPQIVAVVEAAERAAYEASQSRVPDRARPILRREVTPALAALEEVLP